MKNCKNCSYCQVIKSKYDELDYGLCRRYAPKPVIIANNDEDNDEHGCLPYPSTDLHAGSKVGWPYIELNDWCGEFYTQPNAT